MAHLYLSAAHKSSGKTSITLGLCAAFSERALAVQPFKKGPDYIDPMWLGRAAGRPCYNLDFNTQTHNGILATYARYARGAELSLIEGNKGLYDGLDLEGGDSNAALAKLLEAPVILVLDAGGITRGVAPLLLGYQAFDTELRIAGVILNKVAGSRHEAKLRAVIDRYTDLPVLGAIPRDPAFEIEERHLGLVPSNEDARADEKIAQIAALVARQVDLDALLNLARSANAPRDPEPETRDLQPPTPDMRIAIARDAAFGFYYPGDLDALQMAGAELVAFDTLRDSTLPQADALFIGGGFPETQMEALAANRAMREAVRTAIENGMPTYAECGGLMYLTRGIRWRDYFAEMAGIIPAETVMHPRPQGRGYVRLRESGQAPWPVDGSKAPGEIAAHEFHYSSLEGLPAETRFAYEVLRGSGVDGAHDGIVYKNLLANYTHLRDTDRYHWAARFVAFARRCRGAAQRGDEGC
jgi:cobyrinic acid a,c-diamide synthase